jgi:hypothetical protein
MLITTFQHGIDWRNLLQAARHCSQHTAFREKPLFGLKTGNPPLQ